MQLEVNLPQKVTLVTKPCKKKISQWKSWWTYLRQARKIWRFPCTCRPALAARHQKGKRRNWLVGKRNLPFNRTPEILSQQWNRFQKIQRKIFKGTERQPRNGKFSERNKNAQNSYHSYFSQRYRGECFTGFESIYWKLLIWKCEISFRIRQ